MDLGKLTALSATLEEQIIQIKKDILNKFPIDDYIGYIRRYPQVASYGYVSAEVKTICDNIVDYTDEKVLTLYHKLLLVKLVTASVRSSRLKEFPQDIQDLYHLNFTRIINEIELGQYEGPYIYKNDKFRKDIAVCSFRMIPAGVVKIHLQALPKSYLLKKGALQFAQMLYFIAKELGGISPLYEMHADSNDPHAMAEFNEEGWIRFYKRLAEIFKTFPHVKGVFGTTWFFDPVLENISPRLLYLRKIPTENGGKLYYIGPDEQSIKDATFKSPTRRRLYHEGKYLPTRYLIIWPRDKVILWAEKNKN